MKKFSRKNLAFNIISAIVLLLFIFSWIVSFIGYNGFTESLQKEYADTALQVADTACALIDGNKIDLYLENGGNDDSWRLSSERLDVLCNKMDVTLIYAIRVDTSDYGRFESVFNSVNEKSSEYTPWEVGYQRDATNEEYSQIYRELYEKEIPGAVMERTTKLRGKQPHITALVPIENDKGEVTAVMCVQLPMSELNQGRRTYLINIAVATVLLTVLVSFSSVSYIRKQLVTPVRKVIDEAHRFAAENTKGEKLDRISRINEITDLANSIDKMESDMMRYIENLTSVTAEKERIGAELDVAKTIQENSVPNIFPAFPERAEFDIYASMNPAKEVGGDLYNFFLVDEDHLAIVIADVSGKGVPAALFMMVTNILISDRTHMGGTPGEILTYVNDNICQHNPADMFVTVWLGILEISTGKIVASNAGHDDPAICRKGGEFEIFKSRHSLVVGAMPGIKYRDFEIQLNKGDKIFLYTDGLPEATDKNNRMFTIEKMLASLNQFKHECPKNILKGINSCVDEFVGEAPQFDDLTMMCLEITEDNGAKKLTVDATNENLREVMSFVDDILEQNGCTQKAQMQLDLAVEEIFVNIANYAYPDGTGKAEITVSVENSEVKIELKDSGIQYDPLAKDDPDISLSADDRDIGGLGIFLTKKNTDSVSYRYENGQNILTMTKRITQ